VNFLAHSLLSSDYDHWMVGNLVADLIKKKEVILLDQDIQQGVYLHYEIDSFTDSHSLVAEATQLLHATQGKYSPVATDLIWDLCLAKNWKLYSQVPLEDFINNVYNHLKNSEDKLEPKLVLRLNKLIDRDFLTMYSSPDTMKIICEKIHQRTRFKSNLHLLMNDYSRLESKFNSIFLKFYPELEANIKVWKLKILSK